MKEIVVTTSNTSNIIDEFYRRIFNQGVFASEYDVVWKPNYNYPKVDKIIYNMKGKTTIVYWKDGDKTIVKCAEGEDFTKEGGLSACFIKKMFPNRNEFKRLVESGKVQE